MGNYKDSKIQMLAQKGNGNFAYIDSYNEAEKVLMKEFAQTLYTVADDAYMNIKFDPDFVKEYRLIGYDNKVGAIKDKESVIEGGEIGSAYSTMIAFEIVPTQQGVLFAKAKETCNCQPIYFNLTYKLPGSDSTLEVNEVPKVGFTPFNKLPACHQFASSVIMFGSLLRKSKFIKDISWNEVLDIAQASADMEDYSQKEFVMMVQHAKNIYGKRKKKDAP
jgi:Ca-activated chloride channel family protein